MTTKPAKSKRPGSTSLCKVWRDNLTTVPAVVLAAVSYDETGDGRITLDSIEAIIAQNPRIAEQCSEWYDGTTTYTWWVRGGWLMRSQRGPDGNDWGDYAVRRVA